jgi:hypothetical protein
MDESESGNEMENKEQEKNSLNKCNGNIGVANNKKVVKRVTRYKKFYYILTGIFICEIECQDFMIFFQIRINY